MRGDNCRETSFYCHATTAFSTYRTTYLIDARGQLFETQMALLLESRVG